MFYYVGVLDKVIWHGKHCLAVAVNKNLKEQSST